MLVSEHIPSFVPTPAVPFLEFRTSKGKNGTLIGPLCCPSVETIYLKTPRPLKVKYTGLRGLGA